MHPPETLKLDQEDQVMEILIEKIPETLITVIFSNIIEKNIFIFTFLFLFFLL